ncbi:MAG: IS200/IS605 family transposase [Thermoflexales bacterium]|nr:IS200/IS605 family transposase [Thermoflexales bacterium]
MPSTYTSLHYHLVFATKHREPLIASAWRARLHQYMGGVVRENRGIALSVGGVEDHVHLLIGLRPTHCLSDFMRALKSASSARAKAWCSHRGFQWQDGYAAFTVCDSGLARVKRYIERQEEHHRRQSFRDELMAYLRATGIEFDERYLD